MLEPITPDHTDVCAHLLGLPIVPHPQELESRDNFSGSLSARKPQCFPAILESVHPAPTWYLSHLAMWALELLACLPVLRPLVYTDSCLWESPGKSVFQKIAVLPISCPFKRSIPPCKTSKHFILWNVTQSRCSQFNNLNSRFHLQLQPLQQVTKTPQENQPSCGCKELSCRELCKIGTTGSQSRV